MVVSGLPGSGKSTLMHRVVPPLDDRGAVVHRIDSQDVRERWARGRLRRLPYGLYRPLVRAAHYLALGRALRSGDSVVVHDCGTLAWVRRWIARSAARGGRGLHLVLLDVPPEVARSGQEARGRGCRATPSCGTAGRWAWPGRRGGGGPAAEGLQLGGAAGPAGGERTEDGRFPLSERSVPAAPHPCPHTPHLPFLV